MKKPLAVLFILAGFGFGIAAGFGMWAAGYATGRIHENTRVFYATQDFKDAVNDNRGFKYGDYWFEPGRDKVIYPGEKKIIVRKVRYRGGQ
jgi:hypothetical protein